MANKSDWVNFKYKFRVMLSAGLGIKFEDWEKLVCVEKGEPVTPEEFTSDPQTLHDLNGVMTKISPLIVGAAGALIADANCHTLTQLYYTIWWHWGRVTDLQASIQYNDIKAETFVMYQKANPHIVAKTAEPEVIALWANALNSRLGLLKTYCPTTETRNVMIKDRLLNGMPTSYQSVCGTLRTTYIHKEGIEVPSFTFLVMKTPRCKLQIYQ